VTLVDESTFAISERTGDIVAGSAQGLFFRDTRLVSRLELRLDGAPLEPLASFSPEPFSATFVSRTQPAPGRADSTLMVFRNRYVGQGMREDLTIHNFGAEPTICRVDLLIECDFADLFAVKEGRAGEAEGITQEVGDHLLAFSYKGPRWRAASSCASPPTATRTGTPRPSSTSPRTG